MNKKNKIYKKLIVGMCLIFVAVLFINPFMAKAENGEVSIELKKSTVSGYFSNNYFKGSNSQKVAGSGLAYLSAIGVTASYSGEDAKKFLEDCGFEDVTGKKYSGDTLKSGERYSLETSTNHSTKTDNDHAVAYIGHQMIDDTILVGVVINGYSDGSYEWVSNFNLGKGKFHSGFDAAARELVEQIKKYMDDFQIAGRKRKIWIMGHSRGAALTNLVAMSFAAENNLYGFSVNDIFAYGFATPQYTTAKQQPVFENAIINYINPHDFVPYMAPTEWGYRRDGTDIFFDEETISSMKSIYKKYIGKKYAGFKEDERIDIVNAFVKLGISQEAYYEKLSSDEDSFAPVEYAQKGIGYARTDDWDEGLKNLAKYSFNNINAAKLTGYLLYDGVLTPKISDSHTAETYLAFIEALY